MNGLRRRRRNSGELAEPDGAFAVVAEFQNEEPLLMETLGQGTSYDTAGEKADALRGSGRVVRTCVVRLYRMIDKGTLSSRKVEGSTMLSIAELDGIFQGGEVTT